MLRTPSRAPRAGDPPIRPPRGARTLGAVAGAIGIGCCVYPVFLVLLGLSSASAAIGLGNRLYAQWGWAFKAAGALFAVAAFAVQRRRAHACAADAPSSDLRLGVRIGGSALIAFGTVYAVTTLLGRLG